MAHRAHLKTLAVLYLPALFVLAVIAAAANRLDIPVGSLTRDMATVAKVEPIIGALSNIGILLWCTAAAVAFFTAALLKGRAEPRQTLFLFCFGCLTLVLTLDDFFLFHDRIAPGWLGLRERYVILAYLALSAGFLAAFKDVIMRSEYVLLGLALGFFAASIGLDKVPMPPESPLFLAEDGAKFLGLVSWCAYFVRHAYAQASALGHGYRAVHVRPVRRAGFVPTGEAAGTVRMDAAEPVREETNVGVG